MFITANVTEGERYTVSFVRVSGDTVLPMSNIQKMVLVKPGNVFSRALLELTTDSITTVLGNIGYAHAEVNPVPTVDREKHTVAIDFVVAPGPRVQVRRIVFKGNANTADEVLRREMRQFESAWYSQAMIDRSKVRLQRTGFFETVDIETPAVPGQPDLVDVVITVKERNAGSFIFGVGYSQLGGVITSVSLQQNNFLGTGNRFAVALQKNDYSKSINFSYLDPYFTEDGISVGYNLSYSDYSQSTTSTARYGSGNAAAEAIFGVPLSENTSITAALGIARNQITTTDGITPPSVSDYLVETMGDREYNILGTGNCDGNVDTPDTVCYGSNRLWTVNTWTFRSGWAFDTRNNYLFPSRGTLSQVQGELSLPGSDLEYYRLEYNLEYYLPIARWLIIKAGTELGYGDSYGNTGNAGLPFFKNFYAGGPGSVRGFRANTLGPNYQYGSNTSSVQPLGGAIKTVGTFEFYLPKLLDAPGARISTFIDYGNVFGTHDDPEINQYRFSLDKFRISTGIALQWQSPMGPISISYALPIRKEDGDQIERLQFTFGQQ
jgi:outer membrane protein insertion porin family